MDVHKLIDLLRKAYSEKDEELRAQFDRSLPFADGLFDRWERAKRLGFAEGASIYNSSLVYGDVEVGENTWIGPYTLLDGSGGEVSIGSFCSISAGVHIYTHDTVMWALSGGRLEKRTGPVQIGDCCYIASQCIIAPNVSIGRQCVVAANSFVNRDVPERTIVGGNPAKILGRVESSGENVRLRFNTTRSDPP
jgi:acetyltransferase-like isoleucine patch superfamily enzyme